MESIPQITSQFSDLRFGITIYEFTNIINTLTGLDSKKSHIKRLNVHLLLYSSI